MMFDSIFITYGFWIISALFLILIVLALYVMIWVKKK
jgi:hypothetical protein